MNAQALVLATTAALFALGGMGVLLRRNPVAVLMGVELAGRSIPPLGSSATTNRNSTTIAPE